LCHVVILSAAKNPCISLLLLTVLSPPCEKLLNLARFIYGADFRVKTLTYAATFARGANFRL
jgi:hypothetical protein